MRTKLAILGAACAAALLVFVFTNEPVRDIKNIPPRNDVIVAFGDSLVEGVGANEGNDFVSLLSRRLDREIINLGVAGDTSANGLDRISEVLAYDPGMVIVLLGGNDALRRVPPEKTRDNLNAIVTRLQEEGVAVVLIGIQGGLLGDPYEEIYEEISEVHDTAYVPDVLRGILLKSDLTADQIHPNDAGYEIVADRIYEVIAPLLTEN